MIEKSLDIKVEKFSPTLGAIITGTDLSKKINDDEINDINQAFLDYQELKVIPRPKRNIKIKNS